MSTGVVGSSKNSGGSGDDVDYKAVEIPDTDPSEYHYTQRRAALLQRIEEAGHPAALNQTELAEHFGVSQQQISKDLDRLAGYVRDRLEDRNHRALLVDSVVQKAIREMMSEGEYRAAAKTALEFDEFASNFADLEELAERVAELENSQRYGGP